MRDTFLVESLRSFGWPSSQAAAFERGLDDHPIAGMSGQRMSIFLRHIALMAANDARERMAKHIAMKELEVAKQLALFQTPIRN